MEKKKKTSISKFLTKALIGIGCLILLAVVSITVFGLLSKSSGDSTLLTIGFSISVTLFAAAIFVVVFSLTRFYSKFYKTIFETTNENFAGLASQTKGLKRYGDDDIEDFDALNSTVDLLNAQLKDAIIINGDISYKDMNLEMVGENTDVITFDCFKLNITNFINKAQYFRNAFVSIIYPLENDELTEEERTLLFKSIRKALAYPNIIVGDNREKNEAIVFVPSFDTVDRLKQDVESLLRMITISRSLTSGITPIAASAAIVAYPYSNDDEIIADLRFAHRQGKQISVYLPKRKNQYANKYSQSSRNVNNISRLLEGLSSINNESGDAANASNQAKSVFESISAYYGFDSSAFFVIDEFEGKYHPLLSYFKTPDSPLHGFLESVGSGFVNAVSSVKDDDSSYYFSSRKHLSQSLSAYTDAFGIESGYYFVVAAKSKVRGFFYFVKKETMSLDSYLRDALLSFCHSFGNISDCISANRQSESYNATLNGVLKLSNYCLYTIDKRNMTIHSYSETLKNLCPGVKEGAHCYETIFGEKSKCKKCPLRTGKRVFQNIAGSRYEVSTSLSEPNSNEVRIVMSPAPEEGVLSDRFDNELLVDSFFSLMETMKVAFLTNQRGQLLILNIDNSFDLLSHLTNDEYSSWLRCFILALRKESVNVTAVYSVSNRVLALNIPDMTRNDMVTYVEKAFLLSRKRFIDSLGDQVLDVTYTLYSYPSGYQNADEYMRNLLRVSATPQKYLGKNMLFVPEIKYERPASHSEFIADILENSLNKNAFAVNLQALVSHETGKIVSAEMLLRLSDNFLGHAVNTFEVIQAASKNKKIALITDILIDYIEFIYKEYGDKLFKKFDVLRLSLNTDFTFFEDLEFISKITAMRSKLGLPDDFLVFEIREDEIARHYAAFTSIIKTLVKDKISLVCDNYTGRDLSVAKLKAIGFKGLKVDRSIVSRLSEDQNTLERIKSITEEASSCKMKTTLVGVENKEQANLIDSIMLPFDLQGFFYYKPMDVDHFINELLRQK